MAQNFNDFCSLLTVSAPIQAHLTRFDWSILVAGSMTHCVSWGNTRVNKHICSSSKWKECLVIHGAWKLSEPWPVLPPLSLQNLCLHHAYHQIPAVSQKCFNLRFYKIVFVHILLLLYQFINRYIITIKNNIRSFGNHVW